jgi:hypothetical protein
MIAVRRNKNGVSEPSLADSFFGQVQTKYSPEKGMRHQYARIFGKNASRTRGSVRARPGEDILVRGAVAIKENMAPDTPPPRSMFSVIWCAKHEYRHIAKGQAIARTYSCCDRTAAVGQICATVCPLSSIARSNLFRQRKRTGKCSLKANKSIRSLGLARNGSKTAADPASFAGKRRPSYGRAVAPSWSLVEIQSGT